MLNNSNSSPESGSNSSNTKMDENDNSNNAISIPDTCFVGQNVATNKPMASARLMVRDTLDSNLDEVLNRKELENFLQNEDIIEKNKQTHSNDPKTTQNNQLNAKDVNETCLDDVMNQQLTLKNIVSQQQSSTPLAVKKKLQEHGLLDMTNSPCPSESPPKIQTVNNNKKSHVDNKTPIKVLAISTNYILPFLK